MKMRYKHFRQPQSGFGVGLRLAPVNWISAAAVLLGSALLLLLQRDLLWETAESDETVFCGGFLAAYVVLSLFGALLCLADLRLPRGFRQAAGWAAVLLFPLGAFYAVDLINSTKVLQFTFLRCLSNYLCYLMLFALVHAVCRTPWITVLTAGSISLLFGAANYYVVRFRGQPLLPWDLQAVTTAADVVLGYRFSLTRPILLSLLGLLCAVLLCARLGKPGPAKKQKVIERLCSLAVAAALALLIFPADLLSAMGVTVWAWNQKTSSRLTGVAAGFCANVQFLLVDKPEDYSEEAVLELAEELKSQPVPAPLGDPGGKLPTVVAVMCESLTDLQTVGEVTFTPDDLPFLHSLQQSGEVIWGTAYTSAYGGNTCNSEYEFLTGNTTGFFPAGSKPYQQYVRKAQTALPAILKSYGYSCTAIHAGNKTAWQRNTAYPWLGFDKFLAVRDFDIDRVLSRKLTTDASHYEQVIYEYEHRDPDTPQFLFTVTIANHGGYNDKEYPVSVQVEGKEGKWPQTEQYLSLIHQSDQDFQGLLDYFSRQEDPVVVLFFGDHWPNLENGFLFHLLNANPKDLGFEDMMREYQVPFVIWANYPLQGEHIEAVSLNYLSGLLLRAAGLEGTEYTDFLEDLRQELPVITAVGTMDSAGELYKVGEETPYDDLLHRYAMLQYNNAFGGKEKVEELFTR